MARSSKIPFSNDTFLTVLGILAGVCAFVFDQWAAKGLSVLFALALVVYVGRRHGSHPLLRYPVALIGIGIFAFLPWRGIWSDFHKTYPTATWSDFATWPSFHWALAIAAALALGWDWLPFWRARQGLRFTWRRLLAEETWIGRDDALKLIKASRWARLRAPVSSVWEGLALGGGLSEYQRDQIRFDHYIDMTLNSFEKSRPNAVRDNDDQMRYAEGELRRFLAEALDEEMVKRFGNLPT